MIESVIPITLDPAGQALLKRHADWWQRKEIISRRGQGSPLEPLWLPLADGTLAQEDVDLTPEMLDLDRLTEGMLAGVVMPTGIVAANVGRSGGAQMSNSLELNGDLFEVVAPCTARAVGRGNPGQPGACDDPGRQHADKLICPSVVGLGATDGARHEGWLDLLARSTELLAARSGGRHPVVQTLIRGPSDLAEAVLGPELMCLSLFEHQSELRSFLEETTDTFIAILFEQLRRIPQVAGGYVHPFGIWAPGTTVRTQCDSVRVAFPPALRPLVPALRYPDQ